VQVKSKNLMHISATNLFYHFLM